jgi:hypothetical protein
VLRAISAKVSKEGPFILFGQFLKVLKSRL